MFFVIMGLEIKKNTKYAEANITIIGVTNTYGHPQFVLVNSDEGENSQLKFPGLRFRAPLSEKQTLEDCARQRFEEQTGLGVEKMLGLRAIVPTRSRHDNQWLFRNVFLARINAEKSRKNDGRKVYLVNPGEGIQIRSESVFRFGESGKSIPLEWVTEDNRVIAEIARDILYSFNWEKGDTDYLRRIPTVGVVPKAKDTNRELGCGLAVSSMILLYRPSVKDSIKIIMLKRRGDEYPGYVGGKIETPDTNTDNLDPISCCAKEGSEEFGFPIIPRALLGVAHTSCDAPSGRYYNGITTYSFIAEPQNPRRAREALSNPRRFLEGGMEGYVVEDFPSHRDRIFRGDLRMPDNVAFGNLFFKTSPGRLIPLTQIISSGID